MVGSGFPERIGGTISESLLAPDREASRAFPKRAEVDASPVPIAATIALEMIGPIPGTVITLRQLSSLFANASILAPSCRSGRPTRVAVFPEAQRKRDEQDAEDNRIAGDRPDQPQRQGRTAR